MAKEDVLRARAEYRQEEEGHNSGATVVPIREYTEGDSGSSTEDTPVQEEIISPFIPETYIQWAWDSTSLSYFKRCPRLYYYVMIMGYRPKEESVHLRFGIEVHRVAQDYEKLKADGIKHDEAVFHVIKGLLYRVSDWESDHKYKNKDNLIRTAVWYLEKYKNDPAKTYVLENGKPAVELSFQFDLDWGPRELNQNYILCGHLDRLVEYNGEMFVNDIKTTTSTPGPYYWNQFEPDNQMTLYTLASKVIFEPAVRGVMITSAQIMIDDTRFTRGMTYRTQDQLDEWVGELKWWFDWQNEYALLNKWPMNDTACDKYGGCMFRHVCSKSPGVRDKFLKSDFEQGEPWNPLIPRE
jgi:hypothetical protein